MQAINASGVESVLDNALIKNTTAGTNDDIYELSGVAWYISAGGFQSTYDDFRYQNFYVIYFIINSKDKHRFIDKT